uniref:Putative secreted protein n=1 Tax=Anopheles darlingi TaxID=43151 RepID=A0A2M4DAR9_ANODA
MCHGKLWSRCTAIGIQHECIVLLCLCLPEIQGVEERKRTLTGIQFDSYSWFSVSWYRTWCILDVQLQLFNKNKCIKV